MLVCVARFAAVPAAAILWRAGAQILVTRGPCTKLLLLSMVLFAVAIVLRRRIHRLSATTLTPRCEFSETRVKTP